MCWHPVHVSSAYFIHVTVGAPSVASRVDINETILEEHAVPITRESAAPNHSTSMFPDVEDVYMVSENADLNHFSNAVSDDVYMVDEEEHPLMLTGDEEIPFTYLASLSAKWAAVKENRPFVQGKIKVYTFLTLIY